MGSLLMRLRRVTPLVLALAWTVGCGSEDHGSVDAAGPDAGVIDAGQDASTIEDAGALHDAEVRSRLERPPVLPRPPVDMRLPADLFPPR